MLFTNFILYFSPVSRMTMAEYKVEVTTGGMKHAGTWDHIFMTLIGTKGQSERTELDNYGLDFTRGAVS